MTNMTLKHVEVTRSGRIYYMFGFDALVDAQALADDDGYSRVVRKQTSGEHYGWYHVLREVDTDPKRGDTIVESVA